MDKLSNYIYKLTAALVVFFVFCGQVTDVAAQVELVDDGASKEEISLPTPKQSPEELPPLEKIVDFVEYDRTIPSPIDGEEPIYVDTVVRYTYIEEPTSKTILNGSTEQINFNTYKVYSGQAFIQDLDSVWYELKSDVMKPEIYDTILTEVLTTESYLRTAYALAQTTTYSDGGDGNAAQITDNSTWATLRGGTGNDSQQSYEGGVQVQWNYATSDGTKFRLIRRGFLPFDTSALSGTVASATIMLYTNAIGDNTGRNNAVNVYSGTMADPEAIVNGDFDGCGSTEFSSDKADTALPAVNGRTEFLLNADGEANIDVDGWSVFCLRESNFDGDNVAPASGSANTSFYWYAYASEQSGTTYDPVLLIETEVSEPEPEPEATTTLNEVIVDMPYTQELTMITAMTVIYGTTTGTSTPLAVEYTYYHIPLVAWLIIAYLLMNSLWFIYAQVKNYDRRR